MRYFRKQPRTTLIHEEMATLLVICEFMSTFEFSDKKILAKKSHPRLKIPNLTSLCILYCFFNSHINFIVEMNDLVLSMTIHMIIFCDVLRKKKLGDPQEPGAVESVQGLGGESRYGLSAGKAGKLPRAHIICSLGPKDKDTTRTVVGGILTRWLDLIVLK